MSLSEKYFEFIEESIPYKKLGYKSLFDLIRELPTIMYTTDISGERMFKSMPDQKTYQRLENILVQDRNNDTLEIIEGNC